jgi:List-Bact-rpt repeat protein
MATHSRSRLQLMSLLVAFTAGSCGTESLTNPTVLPISLQIVSGDGQQATVGKELSQPLVIRVLDSRSRPVKGQIVNFHVITGGGSVYAGSSLTNANGNAQDYWTMGPTAGPALLEVRAVDPTTGAKQNFATFTATALPETFTLTVSIAQGSGSVVSSPAGIDCGVDCSETFVKGTVVTLTSTGNSNPTFLFAGWSGACSGTGACSVTMDADKAVSASFEGPYYSLFISIDPQGAGQVTVSPQFGGGTICVTNCTILVLGAPNLVTLTATPSTGAVFGGWTGACAGTSLCSLSLNGDATVGASFSALGIGGALERPR